MVLKVKAMREESVGRLRELLSEAQDRLFKHKIRIASGENVNPHEAREMRREIARLKTLLRAIELVSKRAGVDEATAKASLDAAKWNIERAVAKAKAGTQVVSSPPA